MLLHLRNFRLCALVLCVLLRAVDKVEGDCARLLPIRDKHIALLVHCGAFFIGLHFDLYKITLKWDKVSLARSWIMHASSEQFETSFSTLLNFCSRLRFLFFRADLLFYC